MKSNIGSNTKYIIDPQSYQLVATKMWRPKAILRQDNKSNLVETPLVWDKDFSSKKEADAYALAQTKMFLEREGS